MKTRFLRLSLVTAASLLALMQALEAKTIKVGFITSLSGSNASTGQQMERGARLFIEQMKAQAGDDTVELIVRDDTGPAPDVAKRLAQELVVRDKVDFLAGVIFTPNANAIAPIATQAKVPFVIFNAATSATTNASPFIVRVSHTIGQYTKPIAVWAARQTDIKNVQTLVSDYAPGLDAEKTFLANFTGEGKQVSGSVRVPLGNPDFVPFLQKIKDSRPDALFVFGPGGKQSTSLMKAYADLGLREAGIRLIGTAEVTLEDELPNMGDAPVGVVSAGHYSPDHRSKTNQDFVAAFRAKFGQEQVPTFFSVAAYDGMHAIFDTVVALKGDIKGEAAIDFLKHWRTESPRGPIFIDPETRDIVQNVYIRRAEKIDGQIRNVEFETFEAVKDPGK